MKPIPGMPKHVQAERGNYLRKVRFIKRGKTSAKDAIKIATDRIWLELNTHITECKRSPDEPRQREACYRWDDDQIKVGPPAFTTRDQMEAFLRCVMNVEDDWTSVRVDLNERSPDGHFVGGAECYTTPAKNFAVLVFNPNNAHLTGSLTHWVLLHEYAHWRMICKYPDERVGHGPKFIRELIRLAHHYLGFSEKELIESARAQLVRVEDDDPIPSMINTMRAMLKDRQRQIDDLVFRHGDVLTVQGKPWSEILPSPISLKNYGDILYGTRRVIEQPDGRFLEYIDTET